MQSLADVLQNRFFKKFRNIRSKTPVLESLFNEVAGLKARNFIEKRLQHTCFPVKFSRFLRTCFFIEHLRLLLPKRHFHVPQMLKYPSIFMFFDAELTIFYQNFLIFLSQ